ncbi:hypothetical protein T492DRAFT_851485, partial [Pavlovales sp. CCMP2436]
AVLAPARDPKRQKGSKQLADIDLPRASAQIFFGVTKDGKLDCNVGMEIVRLEPSSRCWGRQFRVSNLDEFKSDVVLQIRDERGKGLDLADQYDMRKTPLTCSTRSSTVSSCVTVSGAELAAYLKQVGGGGELRFAFSPTEKASAAKVSAAELIAKTKLANAKGPAGSGKAASKSTTDQEEWSEEENEDEDGASASRPGRKRDGAARRCIRTLHVYPFYATQMEAKMGHYAITLEVPTHPVQGCTKCSRQEKGRQTQ